VDESKNCGNCYHAYNWQTNPTNVTQRTGECRRNPPTAIGLGGPAGQFQTLGVFPPIAANLVCGEHRKKLDRSAGEPLAETMAGAGQIIASQ